MKESSVQVRLSIENLQLEFCPASLFLTCTVSDYSVALCPPTGAFHSSDIQDVSNYVTYHISRN